MGNKSMADQENYVLKLLDTLSCQLERRFHQEIVIFGSSALVLNGVALDRNINDLDVFVSEETFGSLKKKSSHKN